MKIEIYGVAALLVLSLGGCTNMARQEPTLAPEFGNALRTDMALQVVNPEAGKAEQAAPPMEGQRNEKSLERYRKEAGEAADERLVTDVTGG